jgi:nitroimidazol reductase NimA-like FMN-containing flavoprotein (pyridoxamine 5'-phosphate oxidase superfamily)
MFSPLRRKDREISREAALTLLKNGAYGIAATAGIDGYPSGTPLHYACDEEGAYLFFHTAKQGSLYNNLSGNPRICLTVVGKNELVPAEFTSNYESIMAHGTVEVVEGEDKRRGLRLLCEKYSPAFMEKALAHIEKEMSTCRVYKMKIENLCGKHRTGQVDQ